MNSSEWIKKVLPYTYLVAQLYSECFTYHKELPVGADNRAKSVTIHSAILPKICITHNYLQNKSTTKQ